MKVFWVDLFGSSFGLGCDFYGVGIMEVIGLYRFLIVGF